jgi:hypothetical protein
MIDLCKEEFSESSEYCLIFVDCFFNLENMQVKCPLDTPIADLERAVYSRVPVPVLKMASLFNKSGMDISLNKTVRELCGGLRDSPYFVSLLLWLRLCGGKGGFGQLLKAKGHKMNKKSKSESKDLYKTLDGRYVKTLKKLKQMEQMESLTDSERQKIHDKKERLQKILNTDIEKNVKYEDTQFLEDIESFVGKIKESIASAESDSSSEEDLQDSGNEEEVRPSRSKSKFQLFFDEPLGKGKEKDV